MRYANALNRAALPGFLSGFFLLVAGTAAGAQELPEGVDDATVQQGRQIYVGDGFCYTCHGRAGRGVPDLGSNLTDRQWSHTDGSFEGLVDLIRRGVPAEESATGVPMPPTGGSGLSTAQIRAVAAYVWTLSRGG